jgi:hypothetical protein
LAHNHLLINWTVIYLANVPIIELMNDSFQFTHPSSSVETQWNTENHVSFLALNSLFGSASGEYYEKPRNVVEERKVCFFSIPALFTVFIIYFSIKGLTPRDSLPLSVVVLGSNFQFSNNFLPFSLPFAETLAQFYWVPSLNSGSTISNRAASFSKPSHATPFLILLNWTTKKALFLLW